MYVSLPMQYYNISKRKVKYWFRHGIAEAIWINCQINPVAKQRQRQAHSPPVCNQLLSSRDTHTTQGSHDDTETADN